MNNRILPALAFTPRELLWGMRERKETEKEESIKESMSTDTEQHFVCSKIVHTQGYSWALEEAVKRKNRFANRVHPVEFTLGDLVEVYTSKLNTLHKTKNKIIPQWSPLQFITNKLLNSYTLVRLDGTELPGTTHARRLRHYIARANGPVDQAYPR
jgi:hypothetical protein